MGLVFIKEENGWVLINTTCKFICVRCFKKVEPPFFYCKQFNNIRCRKCELKTAERTCGSNEDMHEHFNIIRIEE